VAMAPDEGSVHAALARALFVGLGRFREAADGFEHALDLNPRGGWYALQLAHCAALLRDFPRAERAARQAVVLQEAGLSGREGMMIVGAHTRLGQIAALQERWEDALLEFDRERAFLRSADHALKDRAMIELHARTGGVLRRLGRDAEAEEQLRLAVDAFEERLRVGADEPFTRYYVACALALLGEKERALDSLERAAATRREFTVERARIEPDLESLRGEPRFTRLAGEATAA